MKNERDLARRIIEGMDDADKNGGERDNVRGEDPSKDDDAPEHRDTLDMAGPPDIDKVVTTDDPEFAPDANMTIKDDDTPEFTQEQRSLVGEFWNAQEAYDYAENRGHPVDVVKASKRMEDAAQELIDMGFFAGDRTKMPTLDELGPEAPVDVEEAVPSSVPSAADPIAQYGAEEPQPDNDDLGGDSTIENMADVAHQSWSGWMKYMFGKSAKNDDGTVTLPADQVERWERQMETPYAELSDEEKESDRTEARKYAAAMHPQGEVPEEPEEPGADGEPGPQHSLDMHDDGDDGY